ncbi:MAG: thiol:disulfide interchange protein DsbA/DsbL [Pseudomonadales bacterium]|jgi:thiol:disulfide interchange protein DsbA|tara:strand:+ start:35014 stop:35733 length:720 start_codon:yes stop_codon:yes gene_type:complete
MVRRKSFVHQQKLMVAGFLVTILALIAYLTLETVTDEGAQGDFIAGVHYVELDKPRRIRGDAIEVMEFFSYGCIFCYRFDDDLEDWATDKGGQVQLIRTPLIGSDQWRLLGAHFYAIQDLNGPVELHQGTFRAIHDLGKKLNDPEDLADFVESNSDIEKARYLIQIESAAVKSKVSLADRLSRQARITSTPQLVIQGRYRISVTQDVGSSRMLEIADHLIEKIEAERLASQTASAAPQS